jgi:heterotetrameric sarcosine oxidase gamma subunit
MLEVRSPLVNTPPVTVADTRLNELPGFTLTQVAGDEKALKKALGKVPAVVGEAVERDGRTLLRVAPKQLWVLGEAPSSADQLYFTPLSSGRTRLLLEGARARDVLSSLALIDFHVDHFKPGQFVMTGAHHTPVFIHCVGKNAFHIYALRTFALNVWEWIADVMAGLSHD